MLTIADREDVKKASYVYGANLLRLLMEMNCLSTGEYQRILTSLEEYYDMR